MNYNVVFTREFREGAGEDYRLIVVEADVRNGATPSGLTAELEAFANSYAALTEVADINRRPGIAATRAAYKRFGKDPNRYRPSQEQMSRRIVKGLGLYVVNALADAGNLVSLKSGNSIGIFDAAKVSGDTLTMDVGREGEPYEGIGRGPLNVAGLPIVRDAAGGIGTPTSDNERTKVDESTSRIVATIHSFAREMPTEDVVAEFSRLLETYCSASGIEYEIHRPDEKE